MSSIKKQRLSVLREIDSLSDTHCKPCDVKSVNEGCQECAIGIQIRQLGSKLGKVKVPKVEKKVLKRKSPKPKGGRKVKPAKGNMEEAKRLLAETDLSVKEISEKTGTNLNSLKVYASKTKKKQDSHTGSQNKPSWSKSEEEYKYLIGQLKDELSGRDDLIGKLEATIKKYQEQPANDEQLKELNAKVSHLESACEDVEGELDQYKTKLRIAANALDQSNDKLQELESKYATVERELMIAEENLTSANKSLRNKDAAIEQMERELSYARENERTLKANEEIFKTALKAAL